MILKYLKALGEYFIGDSSPMAASSAEEENRLLMHKLARTEALNEKYLEFVDGLMKMMIEGRKEKRERF